jgi:diguanylate cyclase (GGDEF)-like protein
LLIFILIINILFFTENFYSIVIQVVIILLILVHHLDDLLLKKNLYLLANYDNLTSLPNRYRFFIEAEKFLNIAKRENLSFVVIFIDLDNFKKINDTLGHKYGDKVLIKVSKIIKKYFVRATDTYCRMGGDEFIIFSIQQEKNTFEKFLKEIIEEINKIEFKNIKISASVGVLFVKNPDKNLKLENLIKLADKLMYEIKNSGKNNYLIKII